MDQIALEQTFSELRETEPRRAAEVAYVLARLYLDKGQIDEAKHYGRESIRLFDQCSMESLADCAARYVTLVGIALPSIIHQAVVRDRLKVLNL